MNRAEDISKAWDLSMNPETEIFISTAKNTVSASAEDHTRYKAVQEDAEKLLPVALRYIYHDIFKNIIRSANAENPPLLRVNYYNFARMGSDPSIDLSRDPETIQLFLEAKTTKKLIYDYLLVDQLKQLKGTEEGKQLKRYIADTLKKCCFIRPDEKQHNSSTKLLSTGNLPIYHDVAFDELARISNKNMLEISFGTSEYTSEVNGNTTKITLKDLEKVNSKLTVRSHALFSVALAVFTEGHMKLNKNKLSFDETVIIPVDEYIQLLGYDITEHQMKSQEAQRKEKARIRHVKREAKRAIKADLKTLTQTNITISRRNFWGMFNLVQSAVMENGYISVTFGNDIMKLFASLPKTQFPLWLPLIPGRHSNAYRIGYKFANYYSMNIGSSQKQKAQADRLKVKSILAVTDLPTYKELKKKTYNNRSAAYRWRDLIRDHMETALNYLLKMENGGIESWTYALPGGGIISQEQAHRIDSFEEWSNLLIVFRLYNTEEYKQLITGSGTADS